MEITNYNPDYRVECPKKNNMEEETHRHQARMKPDYSEEEEDGPRINPVDDYTLEKKLRNLVKIWRERNAEY